MKGRGKIGALAALPALAAMVATLCAAGCATFLGKDSAELAPTPVAPVSPGPQLPLTSSANNGERPTLGPPQPFVAGETSAEPESKPIRPTVFTTPLSEYLAVKEADRKNGGKSDTSEEKSVSMDEKKEIKPVFELRGRINADMILVNQSQRNEFVVGDVQDAVGFRRARLGAQGTVGEQVNWVSEFDFAGGVISFKDVYIGLNDLPLIRRVRVGHYQEPFSLEGATSSNYITFVERAPIMALDPGRHWGMGILSYSENERATLNLGVFRGGTSNLTGNDITDQNDMAYDARFTCLPIYEDEGRRLLHLGGAFSQRYPLNDVVTINQGPQSSLLPDTDNPGSPFVTTITVPASHQQLYNLEAAVVLGSLSLQGEWSATNIQQIGGGPVFLHGMYVYASYFVTGEYRTYLTQDGKFGNIQVRRPFLCIRDKHMLARGPGAWELVARFAYENFSSPNIPPNANGQKGGDREAELTVGFNWYLNDNTRIMFNYVHVVPTFPGFGPSYADAFFTRFAIFW